MEERILTLQEQKRELAKAAVGDGAKGFKATMTKLNLNEILNLFNRHDGHDLGPERGIVNKTRVLGPHKESAGEGMGGGRSFDSTAEKDRRRRGGGGGEVRREDPVFGRRW